MKRFIQQVDWVKIFHIFLFLSFLIFINYYLADFRILQGQLNSLWDIALYFNRKVAILFIISIIGLSIYTYRFVNYRMLLKISISFIIYSIISYFIIVSRNLNNGSFDVWNWEGNGGFQWQSFPILIIILSLSWLIQKGIKYLKKDSDAEKYLEEAPGRSYIFTAFMTLMLMNDSFTTIEIRSVVRSYILNNQPLDYYLALGKAVVIYLVIYMILIKVVDKGLASLRKNQVSFSLAVTTSLLLALIFNYALQYGVRSDVSLLGRYIFPGATTYQVIILTTLFLVVYIIFNRYLLSTALIVVISSVISVANVLKMEMRNEPILISDFAWIKEVDLVISFVNPRAIIITCVAIVCLVILYLLIRKRALPGKILIKKRYRLGTILTIVGIYLFIFQAFRQTDTVKADSSSGKATLIPVLNSENIEWMGTATNARYKSLMYVWTKQLVLPIMDKPEGYSRDKIDELASKYQEIATNLNKDRVEKIEDQTVIYILSESLANPNRIKGVSLSRDVLPNIDAIKSSTTSGLMESDGYGGGTANMEFQSLTGLPMYNYSSYVSTLYTEVVPKMSVFPSISDSFDTEDKFVLHPSYASNYSRDSIYKSLKFGTMIFDSGTENTFSNVEKVGVNISDKTVYENVLKFINPEKSQFFSVITMQNHAPWSIGEPQDVEVVGEQFTSEENDSASNFARLISHTDQATKDFLDELSKIDKKITVVFYGDHLPGLYPESAFIDDLAVQYQTDYFVWSNYNTNKIEYPLIRSNDFISILLEHTNSKVTPYQALLTEMLHKVEIGEGDSLEQEQVASDMRLLQYDISVGKGYIKEYKEFFTLGD